MSSAHNFRIIACNKGQVFVRSQFRETVTHVLDCDDNGKWHCSCEQAMIHKRNCKHLKWLNRILKEYEANNKTVIKGNEINNQSAVD